MPPALRGSLQLCLLLFFALGLCFLGSQAFHNIPDLVVREVFSSLLSELRVILIGQPPHPFHSPLMILVKTVRCLRIV